MKSIVVKWTLMVVVLLMLFLSSVIMVNTFYLDEYYVYKTKGLLESEFETLKELNYKGKELYDYLNRQNSDTGYKYFVFNDIYDVEYVSSPEFEVGRRETLPQAEKDLIEHNKSMIDDGDIYYDVVGPNKEGKSQIQFIGRIDLKTYLLITQPIEQVQKNAEIANEFLLYIGLLFLVLSVCLSFLLSKKMVKPIINITEVTKKIAQLEFTERYEGNSKDEIGKLGQNINNISEKLNDTILDLRESNNQLEKEMTLQKRFIASVSHEFKTPVGLIRGYAETLNKGIIDDIDEQNEVTEIIISESDRLSILVNDIVMLMHMDSGTFKMRKVPLDLIEIIEETVNRFKIQINKASVHLEIEKDETIEFIGDKMRLMQVLDNLIANALIHIHPNSSLRILAKAFETCIRIEVENEGDHIPNEHLIRLFEPLYRVENSRSREKGGSGLGLSIVKAIVTNHNGCCGVENTVKGVMFWVELPIILK